MTNKIADLNSQGIKVLERLPELELGCIMPKRKKQFKSKREPLFTTRQDASLVRHWPVPMEKR